MLIRIEHKNKVIEFYNIPGKVINSIETLLHAIEAEESKIISAEFEPEDKKILGIKSPSKFKDLNSPYIVEKDTKCDLCDNRGECEDYLIDCTHSEDTRRHVINGIGHICPKDIKHKPCAISCNGDFMIDGEPCTSCDVYRKLKNKEENKND